MLPGNRKMNNFFGKILFLCVCSSLFLTFQSEAKTVDLQLINAGRQINETNSPRISYTINDNWKFAANDGKDFDRREITDSNWESVNLPHTWNAQDAFDDEPGYRRGASWYRRNLELAPNLKNKRIFLRFEGANQIADVYLNEHFIGRHIGGYTAFSFEITDFVKYDEANLLAVKVDNSFNKEIPPLTADFNMYGGIYRDVWLVATNDVHLSVTDLASPGVQITTPQVSAANATVSITGTIVNGSRNLREVEVINTLVDAEGQNAILASSKLQIKPKAEENFAQISQPFLNPKLWSPQNPYLYQVKTVIRENGKILDQTTNPLGFRWFNFDPEKGFFLNGKPLKLRGTNRHQDYAGLGNAVPDSVQIRDMKLIKDAGFNFVRLAHYPQDPSVLQAADRLGLLLWEEIPIVNYITISPVFNQNSVQMLREMIRQHRNHPSVIMWGYMNEIFLRVPKEADDVRRATIDLARELDKTARLEDSTRPTTIAFHASDLYNTTGLADIPQIVGWNIYSGWYSGELDGFGKFIDDQHRRFPKRPLIISEYGANGDQRLHSATPRRFDSTIEYQQMFHENYLAQINARAFIAGSALWSEFDFGSETRGETIPHVNQKGMFTFNRQPKDVYYFYQANFSAAPVLHIAVRDWPERGGADLSPQKIDVYSNLPEIELFSGGASLGKKKPDELSKATWEVNLREGANLLTAQGFKNGSGLTDSAEVNFKLITVKSDEIAVNVGSNAQFIDQSKTVWLADQPYAKGGWGFIGDESKTTFSGTADKDVLGTTNDPLFQTMQTGLTAYRFDVPKGEYEVELSFVETEFEKAGQRVFDVSINGQTLLEKLDLAKEPGFQRAFTRRFQTMADDGIKIDFKAYEGKPILSAVRIRRF